MFDIQDITYLAYSVKLRLRHKRTDGRTETRLIVRPSVCVLDEV